MTQIVVEGFDIYGTDDAAATGTGIGTPGAARDRALQGPWVELGNAASIVTPVVGARTGTGALYIGVQSGGAFQGARRVLPASYAEVFVGFAFYKNAMPQADDTNIPLSIRDASNNALGTLRLQSNGRLDYVNEAGTLIGSSNPAVVPAGTWVNIQVRILKSASVGVVDVRVNGVTVLSLTGANTGATQINQLRWSINSSGTDLNGFFIDDLVVNNASGTLNNTFPGDLRVTRLDPNADAAVSNWTQRPRALYGIGVLAAEASLSAISVPDSAAFEIGAGAYTMEGWFRFSSLPTGTNRAVLFGKWQESLNQRSYRLFVGATGLNGGRLEFQTSTDGTSATVASAVSTPFVPQLGRWYHIAVQRTGTELMLFIDGVPQNAPITNSATYFDGTAPLFIAGGQDVGAFVLPNTSILGFADEVRFTLGVGRYTSTGFTPPSAAFPRSAPSDPDFASVSFLAGFDAAVVDESSTPKAITVYGAAARFVPDDTQAAGNKWRVVNQASPRDDTYVEAPLLAATGLLTLTALPLNGQTVVYDGVTYTFVSPFVNTAGNVLIGATVSASIDNLVSAINGTAGAGTVYGTGTTASANTSVTNRGNQQMLCIANVPGTAGNSIATTETLTNGFFLAATLTGGVAIPSTQGFFVSRPPPLTTGVRSVVVVTRARKTDSGPGSLRADFQVSDGSTANGTARPMSTTFAYYQDIFETDPATTLALTTNSITGARVRLDRTA